MQGCPGGGDFLPRREESSRLEDCPQLAEDQSFEYELDEDEPRNDVAKRFMLQGIHMRVPVQVVPGDDERTLLVRYTPLLSLDRLRYWRVRWHWYWNGPGLLEYCPIN